MKINSELGYEPVTYSELTDDEQFWAGCKACVNYDTLMSKERKNCFCTAMLYDPADHYEPEETAADFKVNSNSIRTLYERKAQPLAKTSQKEIAFNGHAIKIVIAFFLKPVSLQNQPKN
jgi:hypothetical protein